MRYQEEHDLQFSRVLYFLPFRGPPVGRIDGNQQEEIQCMYYSFGQDIFDIMVLVTTQSEEYQQIEYSEKSKAKAQKIFQKHFTKRLEFSFLLLYL